MGALGLLIVYGHLYPFEFRSPQPGALVHMLSNWTLISSRGDMLGNVALFVPWGLGGMLVAVPRVGASRAALLTAVAGFMLSLSCQIAQVWTPSRDGALADVFWNMLGVAVGLALGGQALRRRQANTVLRGDSLVVTCLLSAWLLTYWLPLIPSIDLQLLKDNLKAALSARAFSYGEFMPGLAMALMSGYLLNRLAGFRASLVWLPAWLALAAFGKLFIHDARIDASAPLGFIAGTVMWWTLSVVSGQRRSVIVALMLIAAYTVHGLSPFVFRDVPGAFGWSPLAAMLKGSMLANAEALGDSLVIFTSFLYLVQVAGGRPAAASVGLAVWVLGIEIAQRFIQTHTADITQPLLALLLGQAFRMTSRPPPTLVAPVQTRPSAHSASPPQRSPLPPILVALVAVALITIALKAVLRLPGIPYNVAAMFLDNGNPLALAVFALVLLWAGAGSAWLGRVMATARRPGWLLPPMALAVSLISLSLLWMSVTTERIGKVSGSSNLYWFVINHNIWGDTWRAIFQSLGTDFISLLERCVRYSALYAPMPIFLGLMIAARASHRRDAAQWVREAGVLASAVLTLWLCKAIAFDWSSTDNLNELLARDGDWGWGGGGYLYGLLALICLNSLILSEGLAGRALVLLGSLLFTLVAVPLGWWLLNQGLEPEVHKYGSVFSGAQFLLGPDRIRLLPAEVLFVRWAAVQAGATIMIAIGAWLGRAICSRSWRALHLTALKARPLAID
jgi:VanZ family protein